VTTKRKSLPELDGLLAIRKALDRSGTDTAKDETYLTLSMDGHVLLFQIVDDLLRDQDPSSRFWELKGRPKQLSPAKIHALILFDKARSENGPKGDRLFESVAEQTGLTFDVVQHLYRDEFRNEKRTASKRGAKVKGKK
jgi:hypothetical protein